MPVHYLNNVSMYSISVMTLTQLNRDLFFLHFIKRSVISFVSIETICFSFKTNFKMYFKLWCFSI